MADLSTPNSDDVREFFDLISRRLEVGTKVYGDHSFLRPPAELAGEIEEEILDICGWSFVLWCRLRRLSRRLAADTAEAAVDREGCFPRGGRAGGGGRSSGR
jgi:hypothetical protein